MCTIMLTWLTFAQGNHAHQQVWVCGIGRLQIMVLLVGAEAKTVWQIPLKAGTAVIHLWDVFVSAYSPNSAAKQPRSPLPLGAHLVKTFTCCLLPVWMNGCRKPQEIFQRVCKRGSSTEPSWEILHPKHQRIRFTCKQYTLLQQLVSFIAGLFRNPHEKILKALFKVPNVYN